MRDVSQSYISAVCRYIVGDSQVSVNLAGVGISPAASDTIVLRRNNRENKEVARQLVRAASCDSPRYAHSLNYILIGSAIVSPDYYFSINFTKTACSRHIAIISPRNGYEEVLARGSD